MSQSSSLRCSASLRVGKHFDRLSDLAQSSRLSASSLTALGIAAASFARRSDSGGEQRYSGKPDGGAVSGAGTPKERQQDAKTLNGS
ncbi:MAG: hypothetical protein IKY27_05850 [Bacteroidales bacterium]|nr:hypothetical protein [Bacteroidales bacterium]